MKKLSYDWTLKDAEFTKDKGSVFSCFACGGGSTMGYKLAGFDVIGCNEIDPKMMDAYTENHKPKFSFLESIETLKKIKDLPKELYDLDILDGSPPCSSFSMAGNREKDWGKEKKFREGQAKQVLDNLFFDFIDLAKELQPKVVIAENVKGLLQGNARAYVRKIHKEFEKAGYYCQHFLLDASKMGVPQRRERIFFVCLRKDLAGQFLTPVDMFTEQPKIEFNFNERAIPFGEIEDSRDKTTITHTEISKYWDLTEEGKGFNTKHPKGSYFGDNKAAVTAVLPTICADAGHGSWHHKIKRRLNSNELKKGGSYPSDYNFKNLKDKYLIGMSVPPLMMAKIANEVYKQWLSKI